MAEEIKDKERAAEKEPQLLELIKSVRDQIELDGQANVKHVDERYSNNIGYFTFSKNEKKVMSNIMLVHVINEQEKSGENRVYVQDEKNNYFELAREVYDIKNPTRKRMIKRNDVEFDEGALSEQIEKSKQLQIENDRMQAGNQKGGDGRDLPQEQHEERIQNEQEEKKEDKENENQVKTVDGKETKTLENLKGKIEIRDTQQVRLDTLINGFYLYELLQLQDKLKGRLPDGINERGFRTGYLTIVKSEELTAKDGKQREQEYTFVVQNFSGDMVELDNSILEPERIGSLQEREAIEKERHYENREGEESEKPDTQTDLLTRASYRIVGANQITGSSENYSLEVNMDEKWKREADTPEDRYTQNIVFSQTPRERNLEGADVNPMQKDREKVTTYLTGKGENETPDKRKEERDEQLKKQEPGEAHNIRKDHIDEIIDRHPDLLDVYNRNELGDKIKQWHDEEGLNDEEVEKNMQQLEEESKGEHDQPGINSRRGH